MFTHYTVIEFIKEVVVISDNILFVPILFINIPLLSKFLPY